MGWSAYIYFLIPSILLWLIGGFGVLLKSKFSKVAPYLYLLASLLTLSFALGMWATLGRAPMRTMGETRLWYAIYISIAGFVVYKVWNYKWMLSYAGVMATVFSLLIFFIPEVQNKNLMPALRSYWFVPHVSVYIISYALMAVATVMAIIGLWKTRHNKKLGEDYLQRTDRMVYVGLGFLLLGLVMGALWAKEVWSSYWSWDPKETWAFVTCVCYLLYVHLRYSYPRLVKASFIILIIAFVALFITWKGVNYLPSAKASMHTYTKS